MHIKVYEYTKCLVPHVFIIADLMLKVNQFDFYIATYISEIIL